MTKLLITGPREIKDRIWVKLNMFLYLDENKNITVLISGNAVGVDQLAEDAVRIYNINLERRNSKRPAIKIHRERPKYAIYGKPAPFIRNQTMVDMADECLALHNGKDGGTADTIKKAKKKGIPISIVLYPDRYEKTDNNLKKWL